MIRITDPFRQGSTKFQNNPQTPVTPLWLNHVQEELVTPIEANLGKLTEKQNQLKTAIEAAHQKITPFFTTENIDYSGTAVSIPNLKLGVNDKCSFYVLMEALPTEEYTQLEPLPIPNDFTFCCPLVLNTIGSRTFETLQKQLSTNAIPEHASIKDLKLWRYFHAKAYLEMLSPLSEEYFIDYNDEYIHLYPESTLALGSSIHHFNQYHRIEENHFNNKKDTQNFEASPLLSSFFLPTRPLFFEIDSKGQVHYLYNKLVYGNLLEVKFSIFLVKHTRDANILR